MHKAQAGYTRDETCGYAVEVLSKAWIRENGLSTEITKKMMFSVYLYDQYSVNLAALPGTKAHFRVRYCTEQEASEESNRTSRYALSRTSMYDCPHFRVQRQHSRVQGPHFRVLYIRKQDVFAGSPLQDALYIQTSLGVHFVPADDDYSDSGVSSLLNPSFG
jgi:hypothetical protein